MDRDARDVHRGHEHWDACELFCRVYDQAAFDPGYDTEPLEFFEPMVRRVMAKPIKPMIALAE
jgi:predicted HD phosphohydrolase